MIKKLAAVATGLVLATVMSYTLMVPNAYAAVKKKVDCDKVMEELNAGKKPKEVAKDLNISVSSVRRCKKASAKAVTGAEKAPAATASPSGK